MRDLILLHGALGAAIEFDELVPYLEQHFKVYRFDLSGHGQNNSEEEFSMQLFARDLKNFIQENNLELPQIFGYSMGGYVSYTLAKDEPELIGDIMSLGTKLKWDPLIAKLETSKLNPEKIMEKVPQFGAYLESIHLDWKKNMEKTAQLMIGLGNGDALTFEDFGKIKNKCFIGLGDMDEMVSCQETIDVDAALLNSHYYKLPNSRHSLPQLDKKVLAEKIIEFLS
jgi:pimeloyl-ACP methyl ester carboxylesterase